MHVISPATYQPKPVRRRPSKWWLALPVVLVAVAGGNFLRPLPAATATVQVPGTMAGKTPQLAWPAWGQAAIGAPGYDILASNGTQKPLATASIAKVITALCVLDKQPLALGQSGPIYTVGAADVAIYNRYVEGNGSVAAVTLGETLTERQALEALMLPSANNVADSLATWVFGGQDAYKAYASTFLAAHGLTQTTIGIDASGYDASTTSTASDLTKLGLLALQSPALLSVTRESSAVLPVAGTVYNYDTILGTNGINGLKTGNNDTDLGAFLFTASARYGDKTITMAGAVMDAPDLPTALKAAAQLCASMQQGFEQATIARAGQALGQLNTAWGASSPIVTTNAVQVVRWKDTALSETHSVSTGVRSGSIGKLQISAPGASSQTTLRLAHPVADPSFWWRLTRH